MRRTPYAAVQGIKSTQQGSDLAVGGWSSEFGQARIPSGWGIIKAAKKLIPAWGAPQVGMDPAVVGKAGARNSLVKLFIPFYQRECGMLTGETPAEAAAKLAEKIAGFKA